MVSIAMSVTLKRLSDQSWFEIKAGDKIIHIDPAYMHGAKPGAVAGDKADLILLTHNHTDHCDSRAVADFSKADTRIIGPASCAKTLHKDITIIAPGQEISIGDITIKAVAAYTTGVLRRFLHKKGVCVGYLITAGGQTIYHAGDTDFIQEMSSFGPVDVALLPIGGLFTMAIDGAAQAAVAVKPKVAVPMHQLRKNPILFKEKLIVAAPGIIVVLMKAGEELTV